ncbi:MAG TPA: sulfotransferase [Aestuariivirga sp.]|nr:sulfotransferase [Aestuariivirga sp.]
MQAGRHDEAEAEARALQQLWPDRGDVNEALALILINMGKLGDAFPFAEAAVKAAPRNSGYLINLGRLYLEYELIEEALPMLEKAFRIDPKMYQAPWAMGQFFHKTGNGQKAIRYLKQAFAAAPAANKNEIQWLLADSLSSLGEIDEAERIYKGLSAAGHNRPYALSQIANFRKHKIDSDMFATLQEELRSNVLAPGDSMRLHLAIGRIYENSGDYSKAFEHFRNSKSNLRVAFDIGQFRELVDNLIEGFQPEVLQRFEGYGDPSRLPVFVVGMPRSGTTLTEQIIAAHPKAGGVGELKRISRMRQGLSNDKRPSHLFTRMQEGGPARCREWAGKYVSMLRFLAPEAKRVVDKMPHNFIALGFIALFFPNARIVHCIRNPGDNFISAFQNPMNQKHSYAFAVEDYALYYKEYLRLMQHWRMLLPERIFDLRYEHLVAEPEKKTRQLLEFLDLSWDPRCLRFHERGAMVKTISRQQVRDPVHQGSVQRWRYYEAQLQPLLEMLKEEMAL